MPAALLGYIAPYRFVIHSNVLPPWNPLRWDGIAQFYPWRLFTARTIRSGFLPLWNPYAFCGAPFVANNQSAVFYPPNFLLNWVPTLNAFSVNALLHLTFSGWFTYLLLCELRCHPLAALLGGTVYAYSAWQVQWLQLPTFIATSCWFPLILRELYRLICKDTSAPSAIARAAIPLGLMLLAGHLQIAFYGLLAALLWATALLIRNVLQNRIGSHHISPYSAFWRVLSAFVMAGLLGSIQLLPTLELSRLSHRSTQATSTSYRFYIAYALQPYELATLFLPNLTGNDYAPYNRYWGFYLQPSPNGTRVAVRHNAAETALYVGILPLVLGAFALFRAVRRRQSKPALFFFALLALFALLMALGTPLNMLFYFGIPGFGASGSPARVLVLWALALAAMAAFGADELINAASQREHSTAKSLSSNEWLIPFLILAALFGISLLLVNQAVSSPIPGFDLIGVPPFSEALARIPLDWVRCCGGFAFGLTLFALIAPKEKAQLKWVLEGVLLLTLLDLFSTGMPVNPTSPPQWVYPTTPGIRYLQNSLGHDRIFPINRFWSLDNPPSAILPPNGPLAYGLRDVQGYDSLFPGQFKAFADQFARPNALGVRDASPLQVGNMVFFQNPNVPLAEATGARYAVALPTNDPAFNDNTIPPTTAPLAYPSIDLTLYPLPNSLPRARFVPTSLPAAIVPAIFLQDLPCRVLLRFNAPSKGMLLLSDENYPGWRAFLDGRPISIQPPPKSQGSLFRAIPVANPGPHTVSFQFQPTSFLVGLYLSLISALGIAALFTSHIGRVLREGEVV